MPFVKIYCMIVLFSAGLLSCIARWLPSTVIVITVLTMVAGLIFFAVIDTVILLKRHKTITKALSFLFSFSGTKEKR